MFIFYFCLSNCAFVVKQAHEVAIYTLKIMTIGIINAMHKEHEQLVALLHDVRETPCGHLRFVEGRFGALHLVLAESGIGKVNAAVGAVELLRRYAPDALVNTGVAGGLDAQVGVMHVVAGQRVAYHDVDCGPEAEHGQVQGLPLYFEADAQLLQAALQTQTDTPLHSGLICSGDQFITDKAELHRIKTAYPEALAVDMESAAIAQVCHLYGVPFLSFRIISDTPGADNHFDQYLDFWSTMAHKSFGVTRALLQHLAAMAEGVGSTASSL